MSSSRSFTLRSSCTRSPVERSSRVSRLISTLCSARLSYTNQAPPQPSTSTVASRQTQRSAPLRTSSARSLPSAPSLTVETTPTSTACDGLVGSIDHHQ
eukprot:scaffold14495_cov56-Phaeocystis_antarctica.AAC.2